MQEIMELTAVNHVTLRELHPGAFRLLVLWFNAWQNITRAKQGPPLHEVFGESSGVCVASVARGEGGADIA